MGEAAAVGEHSTVVGGTAEAVTVGLLSRGQRSSQQPPLTGWAISEWSSGRGQEEGGGLWAWHSKSLILYWTDWWELTECEVGGASVIVLESGTDE